MAQGAPKPESRQRIKKPAKNYRFENHQGDRSLHLKDFCLPLFPLFTHYMPNAHLQEQVGKVFFRSMPPLSAGANDNGHYTGHSSGFGIFLNSESCFMSLADQTMIHAGISIRG